MLNNMNCNIIAAECKRLKRDLTHRGFRRLQTRVLGDKLGFDIVFDLKAGESPKKSVFERMAAHAEANMADALELARHFTLEEKTRSPKYGKITYRMQAAIDSTAPPQ